MPVAVAAGEIFQTTSNKGQAIGANSFGVGGKGYAWQSYQEYQSTGDLQPEISDSYGIGFVWDIDVSVGMEFSAEDRNIKVEDIIGVPSANALLNVCMASENFSSPACDV